MTERIHKQAHSLDGDGVIWWRIPYQLAAVPLFGRMEPEKLLAVDYIPAMEREVQDLPLRGFLEKMSFDLHKLKPVPPYAYDGLQRLYSGGDDLYLNTGRRGTKKWIELTTQSMKDNSIDHFFTGLAFRPPGNTTVLSKLESVDRLREIYDGVTHYDDNPYDAVPIAATFPDVRVILIHDHSTMRLLRGSGTHTHNNLFIAENLYEAASGNLYRLPTAA